MESQHPPPPSLPLPYASSTTTQQSSVRYGLSDVPKDSCFLRSRPYLDLIERTMSQLVQWGGTATASPALAAAGAGAATATAAVAVPKAPTSGFGGGATGGGAAKKGGGGKKKKTKRKK